MEKRQDFTGFRFGNIHSSQLHLVVVSSSNRYSKHTQPAGKDYTVEIPGGDGSYYFGQTMSDVEFNVNVAFESVDEITWRKISQVFTTDKLQDLIFDENPYKVYKAKLSGKPDFKFVCFTDRHTKQRIYKGEGTLKFICYFPYALAPNRYIVEAADYYITTPPEKIIKEHYNISGNMNKPWKGGYPTIEQVRKGELFYNNENGEKLCINTRGYWDNIPEWAYASKLLTTPTLDYEQNLIYMPQYSKIDYMNMDLGLCKDNPILGSKILIYNPGDLSIPFEIQFKFNERMRALLAGQNSKLRIRRMNVDRLNLVNAVDWVGLKTEKKNEEEMFKYGKRYFKIVEGSTSETIIESNIDTVQYGVSKVELGEQHPNCAYYIQPIPRERLGHYIKLFFWQNSEKYPNLYDFDEGAALANKYEELLELCIAEEEKQELYWKTLKELFSYFSKQLTNDISWEELYEQYINHPQEYIIEPNNLSYEEELFDSKEYPQYFTQDYLDIDINKIKDNTSIFLDFDKRMLYNIIKSDNMFKYKSSKNILNDAIVKGKWFDLPIGWSIIEIAPIIEGDNDFGKRWQEARSFDWGYGGITIENEEHEKRGIQKLFDRIYQRCANEYVGYFPNEDNIIVGESGKEFIYDGFSSLDDAQAMNIQFRRWFNNYTDPTSLEYKIEKRKTTIYELEFLKKIQLYWKIVGSNCLMSYPVKTHEYSKEEPIEGNIYEWWWYACNYVWANFPPPYWSYAGLIDDIQIKYIPRYY